MECLLFTCLHKGIDFDDIVWKCMYIEIYFPFFRGLDVQPKTLDKFAKNNDPESAAILDIIFREEITHVAAGLRWFTWVCNHSNPPMVKFSSLVLNMFMFSVLWWILRNSNSVHLQNLFSFQAQYRHIQLHFLTLIFLP